MAVLLHRYEHHRRTEEHVAGTAAPPTKSEHFYTGINGKIGLKITLVVGTMGAAYLFTLLALISAPSAFKSGNSIIIVAWIAQTFLQLVLLPIIIVGQNIQAKASDKRAEQTYDDAEAVLHEALQIQQHLAKQDEVLTALVDRIATMGGAH